MLSGNGRHRRPRQAPAILVAAGVTGSALALPLLGAASAHAADGTTWDKVAECESGGSWSADTGNGYYGGLQMSQDDWDTYGGGQYASSPDLASRSQQIAVAEKILADQGTTPWATCALLSGLTSNSGSVTVDPGTGGSGDSSASGDSSGSMGSPGSTGSGGAAGSTGSGDGDSSGTSGSSGLPDSPASPGSGDPSTPDAGSGANSGPESGSSATPSPDAGEGAGTDSGKEAGQGSGSESGTPAQTDGTNTPKSDKSASSDPGKAQGDDSASTATPGTGYSDNSWQSGSSWSLVDTGALDSGGRHRGDTADENVTNGQDDAVSGRHASRDAGAYTVREGDTLVSIADSLDVDGGWHALYATNKKTIGTDPNHIAPGQTLRVGP